MGPGGEKESEMASIKVTERIGASAEAVWDLFRDFGGVQRYSPQIEGCSLEGEGIGAVRTLTMPGGLELQERLEAFDDAARCLQYSIISGPLPFEDYLSTVEVREDGDGCHVEWSSTFEPKGIAEEQAGAIIEGIYRGGIKGVRGALGL
jgi:ligand-binding SRPBCC domain-containing protein